MNRATAVFRPTALAAAIAAATALPTLAQTVADAPAGRLEVVTVTAQRRAQDLQDIPVSVTAFTEAQMQAAQIRETGDLVRYVPSLTGGMNTGTGGAVAFYMRGLGSTEQVPTFDVPVAFYVDEIYIARQSVNNVSMFDVERVEVLRGPQGTLFGRNATGGAISVHMAKPNSEAGGFVEAGIGSFGRYSVRGSVDMPVNENFLTKLSAFYIEDDGHAKAVNLDKRVNGEETWGVRAAATVMFSDDVTWDVAYDYIDSQRTTLGYRPFDPKWKTTTGLDTTSCDSGIIDTFLNERRANCAEIRTGGITSNLSVDYGWTTMNIITGYRTTNQNFALDFQIGGGTPGPLGGFVIANTINHTQLTNEIKFVGETGIMTWVAGGFYLGEESDSRAIDTFGLSPVAPLALVLGEKRLDNATSSYAGYFQGDFQLTQDLVLTLGARYTEERKRIRFQDLFRGVYPAGFLPAAGPANTRPSSGAMLLGGIPLNQTEKQWSPRIAVNYNVNNDLSVFASATNGFKSGGWNARANSALLNTDFGPEEIWTYELGMKSEWLGGNLRFNANVYWQDVEDLQLLSGFDTPTGIQFVTQNVADLRGKGLEMELSYAPTDNLELFVNGSLSDGGKYRNLPEGLLGAGGVPCSNIPEPLNCTTASDDPVRYPKHQLNAGATYRIPVPVGQLALNAAFSYQSSFWSSTYNDLGRVTGVPFNGTAPVTARLSETGNTLFVNLGATYTAPDERWTAILECQNCSNEYMLHTSLAGTGYAMPPRWLNMRVRYNF
jgi:iron complex outermembrane receptor protein